jgi:2-oxoglutarate decarboxylase
VAMPSTPASYFHLLRWQALSGRVKPMIVFTPKSMLRRKEAVSAAGDFTSGAFQPVLADPALAAGHDPAAVRRVILCAGKIYYDLAERRAKEGRDDVALIRVERLYPLPAREIAAELSRYPATAQVAWTQEEPANMGAWPTMGLALPQVAGRPVLPITLPASSAPAAGSAKAHAAEHGDLVSAALHLDG